MTKQVSNIEQSALVRVDSYCPIDFTSLFDNNQFDELTNGYDYNSILKLTRTISDEELRNYVLKGIKYEYTINELKKSPDRFEELLTTTQDYNELQKKCRDYYLNPQKTPFFSEPTVSTNAKGSKKVFNARQQAIFSYYLACANKVYFNGQEKNCEQKTAQEILSVIFGKSEVSYKGLIIPDFEKEQVRADMQFVKDTIIDIFPNVAALINDELINLEEEFDK